jgi:hypothetical protein
MPCGVKMIVAVLLSGSRLGVVSDNHGNGFAAKQFDDCCIAGLMRRASAASTDALI